MITQPLKGFRDFLPAEQRKRQYVIGVLKKVFESYGFEPLETPSLEYEEVLLGKYGDEGDKLMYRFEDNGGRKVTLRYDQTVPLSRVVAQYQNELPMPFKRYQIQPVWRAENTQKGRYREFLQCDVDTVGLFSANVDAELLVVAYEVFKELKLDIKIKINDRELLKNIPAKALPVLDKLNKIGEEGVLKELEEKGFSREVAKEVLVKAKTLKKSSYLQEVINAYKEMGCPESSIEFDGTLIRGLDYYTGIIMEIVLNSIKISLSLAGGGRYDDLIGKFTNKQFPANGLSFGFDRIIETMNELNLFPDSLTTAKVLVTIFSPELKQKSIELSSTLRSQGINTELYLDENANLEKQLKYADKKGIPYVVIIGDEEMKNGTAQLKNMKTRDQRTISQEDLPAEV